MQVYAHRCSTHKGKATIRCSPAFPPAMTSDKDILPKHPIRAWRSMCICCPLLPLSMPTDLWVPITKDISPMYANQFSIGGYYSGLPGWEFSVEGYYKQMKHILEYQDGVSFFGTSTNWEEKVEMGEGRSFGLELMAQKTLGKTTGWLAYTLSKTDHPF